MHKVVFILIWMMQTASIAYAQIIQTTEFAKGSINDAQKIMKAYLLPIEKSFDAINHSGTISIPSNRGNKGLSFEVSIQVAGAVTPSADKTFDVSKLNLEEFKPSNPNQTIAQTFAGNTSTIQLESNASYRVPTSTFPFYTQKPIVTLNSPQGKDNSFLPLGFLSLGLTTKSSSLSIRFLPPVKVPDTDANIYSIGVLGQTMLAKKASLPIDLSILAGIQLIRLNLNPGIHPEDDNTAISLQPENGPYDNQKFYIESISIPLELVISKQFNHFNLFSGVGVAFSKNSTGLIGRFPVYKSDPSNSAAIIVDDVIDPIKYSRNYSSVFLNLGASITLKNFSIKAEFSAEKYMSISLGIGVRI